MLINNSIFERQRLGKPVKEREREMVFVYGYNVPHDIQFYEINSQMCNIIYIIYHLRSMIAIFEENIINNNLI